jgi:hypothetical protein
MQRGENESESWIIGLAGTISSNRSRGIFHCRRLLCQPIEADRVVTKFIANAVPVSR